MAGNVTVAWEGTVPPGTDLKITLSVQGDTAPEPPPIDDGFVAEAGYAVTGDFQHGGEVTIIGTTGPGPTLATAFAPVIEAQAEGTQLNGKYADHWWSGPKIGSVDCQVVTDPVRGKVLEKIAGKLGSSVGCEFPSTVPPNTWIYLSTWIARTGRKWDASPTQGGQHKLFRVSTDWNDPNPAKPNFYALWSLWEKAPNGVGQDQSFFTDGDPAGASANYIGFPDWKSTDWIRLEAEWFTGDIDGKPTPASFKGATRMHNGKRQLRADPTPALVAVYKSANSLRYNGALFQNYFGNGYDGAASVCRHDDHVVQVGSRARIELTNHGTWGEETAAEVQIPVSRSDDTTKCKLNLGAFPSTSGLFLQEIRHDGSANCIGRFRLST